MLEHVSAIIFLSQPGADSSPSEIATRGFQHIIIA